MGPGQASSPTTSPAPPPPTSRRALRDAERSRQAATRRGVRDRVLRVGLLVALAGTAAGVPLAAAISPEAPVEVVAAPVQSGPSAFEVLSAAPQPMPPRSLLAPVADVRRVADTASRSLVRDPLPGCDGQARLSGLNGRIASTDLCPLWMGEGHLLRGDAAVALTELNGTFRAAFGRDMCVTDTYRSLSAQHRVAATKPGLAAAPGTSNHGWGLAIDLCSSETTSKAVMSWLAANGPIFGWDNPAWARRGGSGPYEPWHWEYVPGTSALGTDY